MPISANEVINNLKRISEALDKMLIGAVIADSSRHIADINTSAASFTGLSREACIGRHTDEIIRLSEVDHKTILASKSGDEFFVDVQTTVHNFGDDSNKHYFTVIASGGSSCVIDNLMVESEKNLRIIFDSVYDAIIVHDLQGNILDVNKKMIEMYNISRDEVTSMTIVGHLSDINNPIESLAGIWESVLAGEDKLFEWKAKRPRDGSVFDVEVFLTRISLHHEDVILANVRDISEKKQSEQLIRYLSFHDKLTGLYNRAFFERELIRLDTDRQLPISIIVADVNGLKLANDAFGHHTGDALLQTAANTLKRASRSEDIVSRWGGDEFAIILTDTDERTAAMICERITNESINADLKPIPLSIALGHASKLTPKQDISEVIKQAEAIMYANKLKEGRKSRKRIIDALLLKHGEWDHDTELMIKLGTMLAKAWGLDSSKLEDMKLLAFIHDIGKVAVPAEILSKPGPLNEEEWEAVRKHSEIGFRIASAYPEYAHLADDILTHHERWDGRGYPRGLAGEAIPIGARIMAIVDAYDAMTNTRPYRAAMSHEDALKEIERNAGMQFDPRLAVLFIDIMK
ncbi:MAG: sensor domain-containing diguanylate cyclase/phosphohydrolase [Bacillota bacterium]